MFTNVPIADAVAAAAIALDKMGDDNLPVLRDDFLALVELCVRFGPFTFNGEEWVQVEGLTMGSPLAAVLAQLAMEVLEARHLTRLAGPNVIWYRYVDDILAIVPQRTNVNNLLQQLNEVHPRIKFTVEEERDDCLPFLDVVLRKADGKLRFSVYRKPTNKDDFIHYFSAHSMRTKEAVVVGFYLRALRVSSPEYLEEEIQYIITAFQRLQYPKGLLVKLRQRAESIHARPATVGEEDLSESSKPRLVLPNSILTDQLRQYVGPAIKIATAGGTKLGDLIRLKRPPHLMPDSQVYSVPCGTCHLSYIGETSRGFRKQREGQHRRAIQHNNLSNAFVVHAEKEGHLPRWTDAKIIATGHPRTRRKIMEAAMISTNPVMNLSPGSYEFSY